MGPKSNTTGIFFLNFPDERVRSDGEDLEEMAAACQTRLLADRQVLQEDGEIPFIACIESTASTDEISFVTCLILTASSCMCTGKFKSMGIENTLSAFLICFLSLGICAVTSYDVAPLIPSSLG